MTRLLYVHNIAMPGLEANTVNVAKMCSAFAGNGCDVTLAALPGVEKDLPGEIQRYYSTAHPFSVHALPRVCARPSLAALAGADLARRTRADIVYTRAPHVALAACMIGAPTVLELHTSEDAFKRAGRAALRAALRHPKLTGVVAISAALAHHLRASHPSSEIIVAHDGADTRPAGPAPPARDRLKVGFVGHFYRGKGLELIAELAPLCPWADFHLVGGDANAATRLLSAPLPSNMVCHGSKSHADAVSFIDTCDVMLAPYQRVVRVADGVTDAARWMSPLKIFEYMAAGKAILASNLPTLREILVDGETARLLDPDDPAAWADALRSVRDDATARSAYGDRARARFFNEHTWIARARRILVAIHRMPARGAACA